MEENILYELGGKFNFTTLIPFSIFIIFLACGVLLPKIKKIKENKTFLKLSTVLPNALALCTLAVTLALAIPAVIEYKTLMSAVTDETMLISEGTVSDYEILSNGHETFKIGDVVLEINPNRFDYGYNVSANSQSVISNGAELKIGYVDYKGELKIVYIEKINPTEK